MEVSEKVIAIRQLIRIASLKKIEITPALLKEFVEGKPEPELRSFYDYFDEYVKKNSARGKFQDSTRKSYETTRKALKEYKSEIRVLDIGEKLINDFDKFLIKRGIASGRGDVKGSRGNRHKHINAVLHYIGDKKGIKVENPYKDDFE